VLAGSAASSADKIMGGSIPKIAVPIDRLLKSLEFQHISGWAVGTFCASGVCLQNGFDICLVLDMPQPGESWDVARVVALFATQQPVMGGRKVRISEKWPSPNSSWISRHLDRTSP
jgi:hypothetical protein